MKINIPNLYCLFWFMKDTPGKCLILYSISHCPKVRIKQLYYSKHGGFTFYSFQESGPGSDQATHILHFRSLILDPDTASFHFHRSCFRSKITHAIFDWLAKSGSYSLTKQTTRHLHIEHSNFLKVSTTW